jgi:hypothetical protein
MLAAELAKAESTNVLFARNHAGAVLQSEGGRWQLPGGDWLMIQLPRREGEPVVRAMVVKRAATVEPVAPVPAPETAPVAP